MWAGVQPSDIRALYGLVRGLTVKERLPFVTGSQVYGTPNINLGLSRVDAILRW